MLLFGFYNYFKSFDIDKGRLVKALRHSFIIDKYYVVLLDNEVLGKPKDKEDAFKMLKSLSGATHMVVTSICGINTKTNYARLLNTTSDVRFKNLSDETIKNYIEEFNPLDKAGSYGIQELPDGILDKYEGSFENIVGLDSEAVKAVLKELGF